MPAKMNCEKCGLTRRRDCMRQVRVDLGPMLCEDERYTGPLRTRVRAALVDIGPATVAQVAAALGMEEDTQPVMQALAVLATRGLVGRSGGHAGAGRPATYWANENTPKQMRKGNQADVLAFLREHGGATAKDIRLALGLTGRAGAYLMRLEEKGLVERRYVAGAAFPRYVAVAKEG